MGGQGDLWENLVDKQQGMQPHLNFTVRFPAEISKASSDHSLKLCLGFMFAHAKASLLDYENAAHALNPQMGDYNKHLVSPCLFCFLELMTLPALVATVSHSSVKSLVLLVGAEMVETGTGRSRAVLG